MEKRSRSRNRKKVFYQLWLTLGFVQIVGLTALNGCSPAGASAQAATPSDTLLSSGEPEGGSQGSSQPAPQQVIRVGISFFQSPLQADLTVGTEHAYQSHAQWEAQPTTLPPPDPGKGIVLADFRDYTGCVTLSDLSPARLCFNVMPDVSNLGINDREMHLEGIDAVGNAGQCASGAPAQYQLVQASRSETSLVLRFTPVSGCSAQPVELVLKRS